MKSLEDNLLGYLLINPSWYYSNAVDLTADLFADAFNRSVFEAYVEILKTEKPNIYNISKRGLDYDSLSNLTTRVDFALSFDDCLKGLTKELASRRLSSLGVSLISGTVEERLQAINDTMQSLRNEKLELLGISEGIDKTLNKIVLTREQGLSGIGTGFYDYDSFTGGLQKSDLIIIAGETSQGKTSLALSMMRGAAIKGAKIVLFSYEMTDHQVIARLIAQHIGFSSKALMTSQVSDEEVERIKKDILSLKNSSIWIDPCKNTSIDYICNSLRAYKLKFDTDVAIIDYLQLVKGNTRGHNREQEVGMNTRTLKNLAKELDMTIICLSQLSREKGSPRPTLNRLRDSGQIEEAADQVIFVYRPEMYDIDFFEGTDISTLGVAQIIIAKGRNVGVCAFFLNFEKRTTNFTDFKNDFKNDDKDDTTHF